MRFRLGCRARYTFSSVTHDVPLLPEHWQAVQDALRKLYTCCWLSVLGCGFVGIFFAIAGHRALRRDGPTPTVRELSRIRLILAFALIGAGALDLSPRLVHSRTLQRASYDRCESPLGR